ncbi:hypothetical protein Y032_0335g2876 [Ancylostoma ceylanicum]|uniref:Uncharacterized protein n=1 Tax=Ancylostoma ceylanicum TaxID=53326 RepID=A0A016RZF6_9BILA|nr:hypothetical protein Y032_0335g2876 [Ancylostoma ceylanicum]
MLSLKIGQLNRCHFRRTDIWERLRDEGYYFPRYPGMEEAYKWFFNGHFYPQESTSPRGKNKCQMIDLFFVQRKTVSCSKPTDDPPEGYICSKNVESETV